MRYFIGLYLWIHLEVIALLVSIGCLSHGHVVSTWGRRHCVVCGKILDWER